MYLLIFLNLVDECLEVFYINKIICAKLSIIRVNLISKLIKIMTLVMLHGPCEKINLYSFCINNA